MNIANIVSVSVISTRETHDAIVLDLVVFDAEGAEEDLVYSIPGENHPGSEELWRTFQVKPQTDEQKKIWDLCQEYWSDAACDAQERML